MACNCIYYNGIPSPEFINILTLGNWTCHASLSSGSGSMCRCISGSWEIAKIIVIGMIPHTLNATQKSVDWVRQTTSFNTARNRKNTPHLSVNLRQPS